MAQGRPAPPARGPLARRLVWNGAEVAVTLGLVLLLLVLHQLWWTNRQAKAGAGRQVEALEREWGARRQPSGEARAPSQVPVPDASGSPERTPAPAGSSAARGGGRTSTGTGQAAERPRWDQAYAVLSIPRLGLRVPVAQGVSKPNVLNHGYVGHYPGTAQPGRAGNFALAGHRNTHGEPFRYINRLRRGDTLTVETRNATYQYVVDKSLAQTSARDGGVINPVPRSRVVPSAGYSEPGYYITLTTCTPEFTSRYRLVVWGTLSRMTPR
ncbi:class E sortase [Streptomyces sp. Q6]|uniref:Class E sortase n=1 Tax=Streptomyces citrinus TaxID=3118173 RepID=A0ACD5ABN7_9ACTN